MAKRFFYVCAGLLCLALAYHLGASSATAQAAGNPVVFVSGLSGICPEYGSVCVTANGEPVGDQSISGPWTHIGNVFAGAPTNAKPETWGGLKTHYR